MKATFDQKTIDLTPGGKGYAATIGDRTASVEIVRAEDGQLAMQIDGDAVLAYVSSDGGKHWVTVNGRTFLLTQSSGTGSAAAGHDHNSELAAPMPGQVRSVNVSQGDPVSKGQTLLVLEAMKMEIRIRAPRGGAVAELMVTVGQTVERGQVLIRIEAGT
jgi:biotin carboxyl carrier protein